MVFYDVNSSVYLITFALFAVVEALLCSGITFGWTSIVLIFKSKHFYEDLCITQNQQMNMSSLTVNQSLFRNNGLPDCSAQDSRLNLILTISLFSSCGFYFPAGVIIDKFGPRVATSMAGLLYVVASVGLGFITIGYEDLLFPIFVSLCIGGSLMFVSLCQASNVIFRQSGALVICVLHGAFDSSAVILLLFKVVYDSGIQFMYVSSGYAVICFLVILICTFALIPPRETLLRFIAEEEMKKRIRDPSLTGPDFVTNSLTSGNSALFKRYGTNDKRNTEDEYTDSLIGSFEMLSEECRKLDNGDDTEQNYNVIVKDSDPLVKSVRSSRFEKGSVLHSIFSRLYLLELIYLAAIQMKLWYYVGALPSFLDRISHHDDVVVSENINLFGYIQFGGLLITPVIGLIFDRDQILKSSDERQQFLTPAQERLKKLKDCIIPYALTSFLCVLFCLTSMLENMKLQVFSYILYTTVRGFLYAGHGAFIARAFPPTQYGRLYGSGFFVAGVLGLLQYALFNLTAKAFHGNHFWSNAILFVLVVVSITHPLNLWWHCRSEGKTLTKKACTKNAQVSL